MVACFVRVRGLLSTGVLFFWIAPVAFSTLPGSLFEHPSMSQGFHPPTQRDHTTLRSPCSHAQGSPCRHRMCVIAEGLGCPHRLAHAAGGGHFFWRPHIQAHLSSYGLCINRNAKHKLKQLHVGKPRSKREIQRIFRALLGDLSAPMHD